MASMISMKDLFSRRWIGKETISLKDSLAKHYGGSQLSLKQAYHKFTKIDDGIADRCMPTDEFYQRLQVEDDKPIRDWISDKVSKLSTVTDYAFVPSWVAASSNSDTSETRTIEGILTRSHISGKDFPLYLWHKYYDWNFYVLPDKQYRYLVSESNGEHTLYVHNLQQTTAEESANGWPSKFKESDPVIECEWDTGGSLPLWALPQDGDRIWIRGRWIYDCGHLEDGKARSEIHPPKAIVSFRQEAAQLPENNKPTAVTQAKVFIGRDGGYYRQPINDEDYEFDLYLPLQPYPEAKPQWEVKTITDAASRIPPQITPVPSVNPRLLKVRIPLKDAIPHPEDYGLIISGGWSDPKKTESSDIRHVKVTVHSIDFKGFLSNRELLDSKSEILDEKHIYVGINGRWELLRRGEGDKIELNFSQSLSLSSTDSIHITVCGFGVGVLHRFMGDRTGYSWDDVNMPDGQDYKKAVKVLQAAISEKERISISNLREHQVTQDKIREARQDLDEMDNKKRAILLKVGSTFSSKKVDLRSSFEIGIRTWLLDWQNGRFAYLSHFINPSRIAKNEIINSNEDKKRLKYSIKYSVEQI